MPCLLVLLALFAPRLVLAILWLFTNAFAVFETWLWPLLGFVFMPYTTLAYMGALTYRGGVSRGWLVVLVIAVIVDLGAWGSGGRYKRVRQS